LDFIVDDTADKAARLTGLINKAVASDQAANPTRDDDSGPAANDAADPSRHP
jgi:hypothetical protein